MSKSEHYRLLERAYAAAPIHSIIPCRLQVEKGRAEVTIPLHRQLHHGAHAVHGAIYFKACDDAAYFAANSVIEDVFVVTVSFHLHLIRPIATGEMKATGRLVQASPRWLVAESELTDDRGRLLAKGSGSFVPSKMPLVVDRGDPPA